MIFSKSSGYALRALIYLATRDRNKPVLASEIAEQERIPGPTLAKILGRLSLAGVVDSQSGPKGGYWLSQEAGDITMKMIMELFETQTTSRECLLGYQTCPGPKYCKLHALWLKPQKHINTFLEKTTLRDISPNTTGLLVEQE